MSPRGDYLGNEVLQVESSPLWGVRIYEAIFDIPRGEQCRFQTRGYDPLRFDQEKTSRNWGLVLPSRADGSGPPAANQTPPNPRQHPSWSPDGKKILFTRGDVMSNIDLYVMDAGQL